ncbi:MAG: phosphoenolpyruvate--protein phosphotransferase [Ruminococcaceae bacterium]|nr:phosphoenolpyruvate--protein phosphotransferase [Oscillospiraceae bacterium]
MKKEYERNVTRKGVGIGSGCAAGRLAFFKREQTVIKRDLTRSREEELLRVKTAIDEAVRRLTTLSERVSLETGASEAEIFEIHAMLASDEDFSEAIEEEIRNGACAEDAVERAAKQFEAMLSALDDPYLSGRAGDIKDVARQILAVLGGEENARAVDSDEPFLLVADELTPSETVTLDKSKLLGFVIFGGTPNSHASILARAMGIPALIGVGKIADSYEGTYALLDAAEGTLVLLPDETTLKEFQKRARKVNALAVEHEKYLRSLIHKPAVTRSGRRILIYANVGDVHEAEVAYLNGADGIGLLRSEFLYLSLDRYPTEEELFESYRATVERMKGKRIVIRTLDMGADKQAEYFRLPHEENPALGFRGIRISLSDEEQFKTQLRAILRASGFGSISIMLPMVVCAEEIRRCRALLSECMEELRRRDVGFDAGVELGVMIETPAAAIMSDELACEADFFSVGTNDLCQYTLAADRQNPLVSGICEENREPVLRLIEHAAEQIHARDGWIGICGEMAADLHLTQRFADMGIDELSVSAPYLLGLREKVTECK